MFSLTGRWSVNMDTLGENYNFTLSEDINGPVLSAILSLVMATAFVANLFVIIVIFCYLNSLKQPSTIFLTSLLLADFVFVLVMSFSIISTANGVWALGESIERKYRICQFVGFMFWYGVLLVVATLAIISFDRCLSIVRPFFYQQYMKPHTAVIIVIIAWIICAILNTTPLYGFGRFMYVKGYGTCAPVWKGHTFYAIFTIITFLVLIGIIVVTSIWTCCFTRRFSLQQHQADTNIYVNNNRKLIGIFGSLLLVCGICLGLGIFIAVINIFTNGTPYISIISEICFYSITIAIPLVQMFFRPDVRDTVKDMFSKCSSCIPSNTNGNN